MTLEKGFINTSRFQTTSTPLRNPPPKMSNGFLRISNDKVVDGNGTPVILRGAGLGGWMNMENFITGYPAHESQHRAAMLKVLGKEKYEFFFDKFLEYFFTEADAKFFASLGLNCIRLPFNYRHFEDDMHPMVLKESGFKHLDRVVALVSLPCPSVELL
jgi:aryl-phospho-beta-D-glucosidase BglC (GH1 family)